MSIMADHSPVSTVKRRILNYRAASRILLLAGILWPLLQGCASTQPDGARKFGSPAEAVDSLAGALRAHDKAQLLAIIGPAGEDIISSGDEVADRQRGDKFLALYDQKHSLVPDGPQSTTLEVGNDKWPLPIPIVWKNGGWSFDAEAGKEEILNRRIGENELSAIQVCKAIADAQQEFALRTIDSDGINEYAQQFFSDPGKHNGLYWRTEEGETPSPLGEMAAQASAEGYTRNAEGRTPYHGYYYRILLAQGPHAPDGALNYIVNGKMSLGYAVVAYPADYGNSGIMTFIMASDEVVYQKDLGAQTEKLAREMKEFDPGPGWKKSEE
jgi:hypothetical protein